MKKIVLNRKSIEYFSNSKDQSFINNNISKFENEARSAEVK
ncbi:hypothetical protein D932_01227 [Enterococcus casseliflavus 14-MB-W-14]|nr:hypothetical protein D932_01227 [Enterococcus casseliflavus 14-MB-W-14]